MNQIEYAKHRGVTQQLIAKCIKDGKLAGSYTKKGRGYIIDPVKADAVLNGPSKINFEEKNETLNLTEERARLAKEQADAVELKNKIARGELLPADAIRDVLSKHISMARMRLLAIPNRIGQHIFDYLSREQTAEVTTIIEEEINDALYDLSKWRP